MIKLSKKPFNLYELDYSLLELLEWNKSDVVLDVGCGNGYRTGLIAHKVKWCIGLDIDLASVEEANKSQKLDVVLGDGENLPFKDNTFTKVLCYTSFHLMNSQKVAKEMSRVLKLNGQLIITTSNKKHPYHIVNLILEKMKDYLLKTHSRQNFLSPKEMISLFENLGMSLQVCCSVNLYWPLIHSVIGMPIIPNFVMIKIVQISRKISKRPIKREKCDPLAADYLLVFSKK